MVQANPEKLQPEWEEIAATSCAVQNLSLMGTALGVAGMQPSSTSCFTQIAMHALFSIPTPQLSVDDGQLISACWMSEASWALAALPPLQGILSQVL